MTAYTLDLETGELQSYHCEAVSKEAALLEFEKQVPLTLSFDPPLTSAPVVQFSLRLAPATATWVGAEERWPVYGIAPEEDC